MESVDLNRAGACARVIRQNAFDLDECLFCGLGHGKTAPGADQPRPGDEGDDFILGEHERWQVETFAHQVSDTGFTVDRDAGADQVGDVAVDRSLADLEPVGQSCSRGEPTAPEILDDLKEAVGAAHQCGFASNMPMEFPSGSTAYWKRPKGIVTGSPLTVPPAFQQRSAAASNVSGTTR